MKNEFKISIGDVVQSHYKAKWVGVVEGYFDLPNCYIVRPKYTKDGRKQRKPKTRILNGTWLKKI